MSATVRGASTLRGGGGAIDGITVLGATSRAAISGMSIPVCLDLAGAVGISTALAVAALGDTVAAVRGLISGCRIGKRRGFISEDFGAVLARGLQVG